jgi:hypothetical protein
MESNIEEVVMHTKPTMRSVSPRAAVAVLAILTALVALALLAATTPASKPGVAEPTMAGPSHLER